MRTLAQEGLDVLIGYDWPEGRVYLPVADTFVTDPYGAPRAQRVTRDHRGVDFRATAGTPFRAVRDGYVCFALRPEDCTEHSGYWGYGGVVMVWHPQDNVYTWYAHLSDVEIARDLLGQWVGAGKHLGYTGRENGNPPKFTLPDGRTNRMPAHLHFEVRTPYPGNSETLASYLTSHARASGRAPYPMPYGARTINGQEWFATFGFVLPAHRPPSVIPGSTADRSPPIAIPSASGNPLIDRYLRAPTAQAGAGGAVAALLLLGAGGAALAMRRK